MAALVAAAVLWAYWPAITSYLGDQHYQEHFAYLWCFVALTLWHSLKGPYRSKFDFGKKRDLIGFGLVALSSLMLLLAVVVGSSTAMRFSLVALLTGLSVLVVIRWSVMRCLMHGALLQLCFGIPYSFYFPLTNKLRWGVSSVVGLPAKLGLVGYQMDGTIVRFPHYELEITSDCSGIGQLLTFGGIAALGVLSSTSSTTRTICVLVLAVALAWASNVARVAMFVMLVGLGWTESIDNETLHSGIGFAVFLPFVVTLVAVLIKTHRPLEEKEITPSAGRWGVAWALVPTILVKLAISPDVPPLREPSYFNALSAPPDHRLVMYAQTQDNDKQTYETPWLISARFARADQQFFDLFHYQTRSRGHLCVHQVANCLTQPGQSITYGEPVTVAGKEWWPIALDRSDPAQSWHVYYAFVIDGERRDDSMSSQFAALIARAFRDSWDIQLTRVMFPGPLQTTLTNYEEGVLTWLGDTVVAPR